MNQEAYRRQAETASGVLQGRGGFDCQSYGPTQPAINRQLIFEQDMRRDNLAETLTHKLCDVTDWRDVGDPKAKAVTLAEAALAAASVIYPELEAEE